MNSKYRSEKSYNGYTLDVLKSCIAKYSRRGNFDKLVYACIEMDLFAYDTPETGGRGETVRTNFIHRIMIAYLEEISTANIELWLKVDELTKILLNKRKERKGLDCKDEKFIEIRKEEEEAVVKFAYLLANSEHGREMSHYRAVYNLRCPSTKLKGYYNSILDPMKKKFTKEYFPEIYEIYSELEDSNLKKVKTEFPFVLSKEELEVEGEFSHFMNCLEKKDEKVVYWAFEIMSKLKKAGRHYRRTKPAYFLFAAMEKYIEYSLLKNSERGFLLGIQEIGRRWYAEFGTLKENFMCWLLPLLTLVKRIEYKPEKPLNIKGLEKKKVELNIKEYYDLNLSEEKLEIDDFIYDVHTRVGKNKGMNALDFALNGSSVVNESNNLNEMFKNFYTEFKVYSTLGSKKYREKINRENIKTKESEVFEVRCRAQLICSNVRGDTYFAIDLRNNSNVFVKGPYMTKEEALIPIKISKLKVYFKYIKSLNVKLEMLIPDLFPDVPMGSRTKVDRKEKQSFLVFEDLTKGEKLKTIIKSSKLWPETKVVDWKNMKTCCVPNIFELRENDNTAFKMYVYNLIFRWIIGIGDHADRNFVYLPKENTIVSVDDERIGGNTNIYSALKKKKTEFIKSYIESKYLYLKKTFDLWLKSWKENKKKIEKIIDDEKTVDIIEERLNSIQNKKKLLKVFEQ